jgi:hypothetical protein
MLGGMSGSAILVLDYAPPARFRLRKLDLLFFVLSLPALAIPFLNFTYGTSPLEAAEEFSFDFSRWLGELPLLGLSFFIGLVVVIWKLRQLLGPPRRWELWVMLATVLIMALPHGAVLVLLLKEMFRYGNWPSGILNWSILILGAGIPIVAMLVAWRLRTRQRFARALEVLAMWPFLANGYMCLLGFHEDRQVGYWLTLWIAVLWIIELAALWWTKRAGFERPIMTQK